MHKMPPPYSRKTDARKHTLRSFLKKLWYCMICSTGSMPRLMRAIAIPSDSSAKSEGIIYIPNGFSCLPAQPLPPRLWKKNGEDKIIVHF